MALTLHGTWVPAQSGYPARFAIWGEAPHAPARPAGPRPADRLRHPLGASPDALRDAIAALGGPAGAADFQTWELVGWFPRSGTPGTAGEAEQTTPWTTPALIFDPVRASELLLAVAGEGAQPAGVDVAADLRFWSSAARYALDRLYSRQPSSLDLRHPGYGAPHQDRAPGGVNLVRAYSALLWEMPRALRPLTWTANPSSRRPVDLLNDYLGAVHTAMRRESAPPDALHPTTFRVCFRLSPPPPSDQHARQPSQPDAPAAGAGWTLEYLLQSVDDPSLLVSATEIWRRKSFAGWFLAQRLADPGRRLLAGLRRAAPLFAPIKASLRSDAPASCSLAMAEAIEFVQQAAPALKAAGFSVLVPAFGPKPSLRLRIGGPERPREESQGFLPFQRIVHFDWRAAAGDETLTRDELEALATLKQPVAQVRGRWVELDPSELADAVAFLRRHQNGELPLPEALRLALAPPAAAGAISHVETAGWLDDLLGSLRDTSQAQALPAAGGPPGFVGQLRPYQQRGVAWLAALRRCGVGACLADDMGLGKTIQLIALLLHQPPPPDEPPAPTLVICPTSVAGNWQREFARFAPSLKVLVHHGAGRHKERFATAATLHDVVISTYPLLHRDAEALAAVTWRDVVLDEAQNVKNASTKAARAARSLRAGWRAALTGTPVENRLAELWSIFQFLNPGYLGSAESFRERFATPIERRHDPTATAHLRTLTTPFILRRVKTDTSIIQDLPEKNEMKVYCSLTREQVSLYEAVLRDSLERIAASEGLRRRGEILALLTKLKQVCDHPALFLHDHSALAHRSGKLARLEEILAEACAAGDHALVFTQYAEMGRLLQGYLAPRLEQEVLFLHGAVPAAARDELVARFQAAHGGPRVFVLSLKAGGTGLNLTRANQVVHFDRWWNPAVENQATDRAFRIGQRRDVQVRKLLCAGTLEEAIDTLIERKQALHQAIVGAGESWLTELTAGQLRDLLTLRRDAL